MFTRPRIRLESVVRGGLFFSFLFFSFLFCSFLFLYLITITCNGNDTHALAKEWKAGLKYLPLRLKRLALLDLEGCSPRAQYDTVGASSKRE